MSIRVEWQRLVADGALHSLPPLDGDPWKRTVLMTDEVDELVSTPLEGGEDDNRRARLLATLQNIVAGRRLVVCLTPYEARTAVFGRLDPIEESIFDVRCQTSPALRVFGRVLVRDVLF
jgi:hypothetical protein